MTSFLTLIPGYRKTDGQLVCVKQVPKSRVHQVVPHGDRSIPKEFAMHIQASTCNKVVKVRFKMKKYTCHIRVRLSKWFISSSLC